MDTFRKRYIDLILKFLFFFFGVLSGLTLTIDFLQTLSDLLCSEITSNTQQAIRRDRSFVAASYTNNDRQQQRQYAPNRNFDNRRVAVRNRPGLNELY